MPSPKFSENFWGDKDEGFDVLLTRMRQGKQTCKELMEIITARAAIEEDYSRKLQKLSKAIVGKDEIGTLKESLNVLKAELEQTAQSHLNLANELKAKVDKALGDFVLEQSTARKAQAKVMEKTLKNKIAQQKLVQQTKNNFEKRTKEAEQLADMQAKGSVPAKDADKFAAKHKKAVQAAEQADKDFQTSVEKLKQICVQWQEEMRSTADLFQKMDEQRIDFVRTSLWTYSNILSTVCVADDESCERIRAALEKCNIEADITQFVNEKATGTSIPEPLDYDSTRAAILNGTHVGSALGGTTGGGGGGGGAPFASSSSRPDMQQRLPPPSYEDDEPVKPKAAIPAVAPGGKFQVRVLYDYEPQGDEELALHEGEIVTVISDEEDPWWEGTIAGRKGMFPSNFVEKL